MPGSREGTRFPRTAKLTSRKEFQRVFRAGKASSDRCFTVLAVSNGLDHARLGLAIAKRHVRNAVDRNRIKRVTRASFRQHQRLLAGLDIVVLARPGIAAGETRGMHASLTKHWSRVVERCAKY